MLDDERYDLIVGNIEDMELDALWWYLKDDSDTLAERAEMFFWVLHRLLLEKRIRLVHMHTRIPMEGNLEEQIENYRKAFPKNDAEMNDGIWFFTEACPGGSVWQRSENQ
jgi:hypothetical protein